MRTSILAALAATTMLAACGSSADPEAVIETVRTTEQAQLQAMKSDDLVGIARLYADDAVLVQPDGTQLVGGAAIADAYADLVGDPEFSIEVTPAGGWASEGSDLAVLASDVAITTSHAETGEPTTQNLASQTVWTRESGGTWMIRSVINAQRGGESNVDQADGKAPQGEA